MIRVVHPLQVERPIDAPGMAGHRRAVTAIQRAAGAEDRKAAAQAKRDRRAAKRAAKAS